MRTSVLQLCTTVPAGYQRNLAVGSLGYVYRQLSALTSGRKDCRFHWCLGGGIRVVLTGHDDEVRELHGTVPIYAAAGTRRQDLSMVPRLQG